MKTILLKILKISAERQAENDTLEKYLKNFERFF